MPSGSEAGIPPGRSAFARLTDTLPIVARRELRAAHQAFTLFFLVFAVRSRFLVIG